MRLTRRLVHVAAALASAAACGGAAHGGAEDAGFDSCDECSCAPQAITRTITASQACLFLGGAPSGIEATNYLPSCQQLCGNPYYNECVLPASFVTQVEALNPDAGAAPEDGATRSLQCPTSPQTLTVQCEANCTGRLTEGYGAPKRAQGAGERLAARAYLEAVSVYAFDRLEHELRFHRAPPALLRDARRARRDEARHTAMMSRLARERGGLPRHPEAPALARERPLFQIALENAVEGCVRETYGAVQGLLEARTSVDPALRRAMQSIGADECRHAELAWAVHAWAMARLTDPERRTVEHAMRSAICEIAARAPRTVALLFGAGGWRAWSPHERSRAGSSSTMVQPPFEYATRSLSRQSHSRRSPSESHIGVAGGREAVRSRGSA